jgi:hypothetical protein
MHKAAQYSATQRRRMEGQRRNAVYRQAECKQRNPNKAPEQVALRGASTHEEVEVEGWARGHADVTCVWGGGEGGGAVQAGEGGGGVLGGPLRSDMAASVYDTHACHVLIFDACVCGTRVCMARHGRTCSPSVPNATAAMGLGTTCAPRVPNTHKHMHSHTHTATHTRREACVTAASAVRLRATAGGKARNAFPSTTRTHPRHSASGTTNPTAPTALTADSCVTPPCPTRRARPAAAPGRPGPAPARARAPRPGARLAEAGLERHVRHIQARVPAIHTHAHAYTRGRRACGWAGVTLRHPGAMAGPGPGPA